MFRWFHRSRDLEEAASVLGRIWSEVGTRIRTVWSQGRVGGATLPDLDGAELAAFLASALHHTVLVSRLPSEKQPTFVRFATESLLHLLPEAGEGPAREDLLRNAGREYGLALLAGRGKDPAMKLSLRLLERLHCPSEGNLPLLLSVYRASEQGLASSGRHLDRLQKFRLR